VLETEVRKGMATDRLMPWLSGFFSVLAMPLVTIGLCGVISYMTVRRRNELVIGLALKRAKAQGLQPGSAAGNDSGYNRNCDRNCRRSCSHTSAEPLAIPHQTKRAIGIRSDIMAAPDCCLRRVLASRPGARRGWTPMAALRYQ
jgi:hypothetical protein